MNILIVEDEIPNQRMLKVMIERLRPSWAVTGISDSVDDTVEWLQHNTADLIFMDVQLVDGLCFSIFDKVEVETPVIFTTAYDNYAIQAFKVNSIDYLLKPIKENELEAAIVKYERQSAHDTAKPNFADILESIRNGEKKYRTRILIHGAKAYTKIDVENVAYFYSQNHISFARLFDKSEHQVDMTLETIEEQINPEHFFRVNRAMLLNINAITSFEDYFGGKLVIKTTPPFNEQITVSRLKNSAFKSWVGK